MKGCRPLTDAEVRLIAASFGGKYAKRDRALFLLGVKSGFRISELLTLKVRDVWRHGKMLDSVTVQRRNMKGKVQGRTVPLHLEAQNALECWIMELINQDGITEDSYLFKSRKGDNKPITRIQAHQILKEAFETNELSGTLATHSMLKRSLNVCRRPSGATSSRYSMRSAIRTSTQHSITCHSPMKKLIRR